MRIKTDVLVIGGGGAACRAALAAHDQGARVLMVMKGTVGESGATVHNVAEIASFNVANGSLDPEDTTDCHWQDIMKAGLGMTDPDLARILVEGAERAKADLENWGLSFARKENGSYLIVHGCYSSRPRAHIIKGHGVPIVRTLMKEIRKREINSIDSVMISHLLVEDGNCYGALGLHEKEGTEIVIEAGATILATGGAGQLFKHNLNPQDITGDGAALAYEAGAELMNMEFMQMGLGSLKPVANIINAWLMEAGPKLLNSDGKAFLHSHLPPSVDEEMVLGAKNHYPFSSRDVSKYIEISIMKEIWRGKGSKHDGIFLDFSQVEDRVSRLDERGIVRQMWPVTRDWFSKRGVDLKKETLEVTLFGHALNGGLVINTEGETSIRGLFAAGEVAAGPHGADRLGGNMMITCQVFGNLAGINGARRAADRGLEGPNEDQIKACIQSLKETYNDGTQELSTLRGELAEAMWLSMGVVRNEHNMMKTQKRIEDLSERLKEDGKIRTPEDVKLALELKHLLQVANLMVTAALQRRESRGSHYREDYPNQNDEEFASPLLLMKGKTTPRWKKRE